MISKICLDAYLLKELGGLGKFDVLNSVLELDDLIKSLTSEAWKVVCFCITPWKGYEKENEEFVKGIKYYVKKISEILENEGHIKEAEEVLLEAYQKAMPFWKAWDLKNSNLPLERTAATIQNRWKVGSINTEKNLKNSLETEEFFAKSPYSSCFNLCYTRNGSIQNFCNFFQRQFFIKN